MEFDIFIRRSFEALKISSQNKLAILLGINRAGGVVRRPEEYRWSSIGYHIQTENKDDFLSTDFGLKEFYVNVSGEKERIRRYRRYLYEAGSIDRPDKGKSRTRYFTDSGITGPECRSQS